MSMLWIYLKSLDQLEDFDDIEENVDPVSSSGWCLIILYYFIDLLCSYLSICEAPQITSVK